jgi:membrane protease YdiL (CAAX protease family)
VVVPEYTSHVIGRAGSMINLDQVVILIPELVILALGEEIANRALFQRLASKYLPVIPSILLTSLFFAVAHVAAGSLAIVVYDVVFVFINSVIYGIVFHKTKNAYISTISHLISNLFGLVLIFI